MSILVFIIVLILLVVVCVWMAYCREWRLGLIFASVILAFIGHSISEASGVPVSVSMFGRILFGLSMLVIASTVPYQTAVMLDKHR